MSINVNKIQCPNCGANLNVSEKRDVLFCEYCGSKLILTDENHYKLDVNYTHTYREIDEARIAEARAKESESKHQFWTLFIIFAFFLIVGLIAVLISP